MGLVCINIVWAKPITFSLYKHVIDLFYLYDITKNTQHPDLLLATQLSPCDIVIMHDHTTNYTSFVRLTAWRVQGVAYCQI